VPRIAVLDANALRLPFQFRLNLDAELTRLLGEFEAVVPEPILGELARQAEEDRKARAALRLAGKYQAVPAKGRGDDAVIEVAQRLGGVVVTNDLPLLKHLKRLGMPRISLRSRNHLGLEGLE
jgi:hypothetical protein